MKSHRRILKIQAIDHVVLTVEDLTRTCDFYARVLGMKVISFEGDKTALKFGSQKINLHKAGSEFEPRANHPTRGSADLCFLTSAPLFKWQRHLKRCGVDVIEGPVTQNGARGAMQSIYLRDPDGNLIEISRYE